MHLGFQEYLTACEIRRLAFEGDKATVLKELAQRYDQSWWQEVILLLLAQGNPSLFTPFMLAALSQPGFAQAGELLGLILEEAADVAAAPFEAWLRAAPAADQQRAAQAVLLPLLERLLPVESYQSLMAALPVSQTATVSISTASAMIRGMTAAAQSHQVTANGGVELVKIPGGRFLMGASKGVGYNSERPQHALSIRPFYLGRYPVTNAEYGRFLQASPQAREPAYWSDRRCNQSNQPVIGVSWDDAQSFARWAGGRLPTEAEWEYACRAGTNTKYWWGNEIGENRANCRESGSAWSGKQPSPVGSFEPNPFGLYDTHGNAWEWVQDPWHDNYVGVPDDGSVWEVGGNTGRRVLRGGSWASVSVYLRATYRLGYATDTRDNYLGFRLARDL